MQLRDDEAVAGIAQQGFADLIADAVDRDATRGRDFAERVVDLNFGGRGDQQAGGAIHERALRDDATGEGFHDPGGRRACSPQVDRGGREFH